MLTAYLREDRLLQPLLPSPKFPFSLVKHEGTAQPGAETAQAGELCSPPTRMLCGFHRGGFSGPQSAFRKAPLIGPATQATPATTLDGQLLTCLVSFRGLALKTRVGAGGFIRTPPDLVSGNFLEKKLELCPTSPKTQIPDLKLILEPKGENT